MGKREQRDARRQKPPSQFKYVPNSQTCPLVVVVVVVAVAALALVAVGDRAEATGTNAGDYRARRYTGVIGQTDWHTCGPAAVATLLHYYFEIDTDEREMLELALQATADHARTLTNGLSAAALKHAVETKGIPVQGYRLTPGNLLDYFERGGLPVILHVTHPRNHYVVAIGAVGKRLVVADPSWGQRIMEIEALASEKQFSGVALVTLPSEQLVLQAKHNQRIVLNGAARHLAQLTNLRRRLQ